MVRDIVGSTFNDLLGYVSDPGHHVLSIAPAVSPVQPRAVLIRHHALAYALGTAQGGSRVFEDACIAVVPVDHKVVRSDAELGAVVVVTAVARDHRYQFNTLVVRRRSERDRLVLIVVIFVELSASKERFNLGRDDGMAKDRLRCGKKGQDYILRNGTEPTDRLMAVP